MFSTKSIARVFVSLAGGAVLAGPLAGVASAHAAEAAPEHSVVPAGFSNVESCTGFTGKIAWNPGLAAKKLQTESAVLTGTLTGCSGINGAEAGTGTVTAVLSGTSRIGTIRESGSITVNWPASSGLNPSNGTLTINRTGGATQPFVLSGQFTSGAYTGAVISSAMLESGHKGGHTVVHPLTQHSFVNTLPFAAAVNFG
jgi:hypothetical protein